MAGLVPVRIPWKGLPPYRVDQFDRSNALGRHCLWSIVPGWGDATDDTGSVVTTGQRMVFVADTFGAPSTSSLSIAPRTYSRAHIKSSRALLTNPESATVGYRLLRSDADEGIVFPNKRSLSIVGIVRPTGDGLPGGGDPRIFSKDTGTAANDHDLMIGEATTGNDARTRIRIGAATTTVIASAAGIQDDALNLIAGLVIPVDATQINVVCHHMREDGGHARATSGNITGEYNPRITTDIALGANAGAADNAFDGEILCICAFNIGLDSRDLLQRFFDNPGQVFEPRTVYVPSIEAAPVGGRIMSSLTRHGGLVAKGGIAGKGGGLAG